MNATHHRWTDVTREEITPSIARQYVTGDRVTVARFELKKGGVVPTHKHDNEQVSCVLSGILRFRFPDRELVARGGEVVRIPGGVEHEVDVLEDAIVMDVFSPIRTDWIEKTDTYFVASR
jgi:quercetin dioxygenase-like cupin family protein